MNCRGPQPHEWGFAAIEAENAERAKRLEDAETGDVLEAALAGFLGAAKLNDEIRFGVDALNGDDRVIIQFRVPLDAYDWFFNARSGYRGHFWAGAAVGLDFNGRLVRILTEVISLKIADEIPARRIIVKIDGASREEFDGGAVSLKRDFMLRSLSPDAAKLWPCERLISPSGERPQDTRAFVEAAMSLPKLNVPRWRDAQGPKFQPGEGLRAPYPAEEFAWLDLKGGFVGKSVYQGKCPEDRAKALHEVGWT